jgi:glycosyltransferase involved in cell wall biosynthesis
MVEEKSLKEYSCIAFMHSYNGGMSGGDRICLELLKRWKKSLRSVKLATSIEGVETIEKYKIDIPSVTLSSRMQPITTFTGYFGRTWKSVHFACTEILENPQKTILYMSSDFLPDSLPALILKWRYPSAFLIGTAYLKAAAPWATNNPYRTSLPRFIVGCLYFFSQLPILALINCYSNCVFVTSEPDVDRFVHRRRNRDAVVVVKGGVDLAPVNEWKSQHTMLPPSSRRYDVVFVGRFHDQKGILELLSIWKKVTEKQPNAQLALIGEGTLEAQIRVKIEELKLEKNVTILGFRDGEEKYAIFRNAKIFAHPATYDSGGMAAAEGMAWSLPAISFDLPALKTYYPKGMVKIPCYNENDFAQAILRLLSDSSFYEKYSQEAETLIKEEWGWDRRVESITHSLANLVSHD